MEELAARYWSEIDDLRNPLLAVVRWSFEVRVEWMAALIVAARAVNEHQLAEVVVELAASPRSQVLFDSGRGGNAIAADAFATLFQVVCGGECDGYAEFAADLAVHPDAWGVADSEVRDILERVLYLHADRVAGRYVANFGDIEGQLDDPASTIVTACCGAGVVLSAAGREAVRHWEERRRGAGVGFISLPLRVPSAADTPVISAGDQNSGDESAGLGATPDPPDVEPAGPTARSRGGRPPLAAGLREVDRLRQNLYRRIGVQIATKAKRKEIIKWMRIDGDVGALVKKINSLVAPRRQLDLDAALYKAARAWLKDHPVRES